jgi:hypothetical protein
MDESRGAIMADDGGYKYMTYDEAAKLLRVKPDSVRRRAASKKWPKRQGNDRLARVGIPVDIIPDDTPAFIPAPTPDDTGLREELAEARAKAHHLTIQLEEVRQDRDRWHEMAEKLSAPRPGIIERIISGFRSGKES